MTKNINDKTENSRIRVVRVSRLFGASPASVLVHTHDGKRKKIKVPDWNHVNADTGSITESGWKHIENELNKIFGSFEWDLDRRA